MWRKRRQPEPLLVEVIPSRWDDEPVERSRAMLAGLAGVGGFSLEFVATAAGLRFYIRAASDAVMASVLDQLRAAYPQAELRPVPIADRPDLDPARPGHKRGLRGGLRCVCSATRPSRSRPTSGEGTDCWACWRQRRPPARASGS